MRKKRVLFFHSARYSPGSRHGERKQFPILFQLENKMRGGVSSTAPRRVQNSVLQVNAYLDNVMLRVCVKSPAVIR